MFSPLLSHNRPPLPRSFPGRGRGAPRRLLRALVHLSLAGRWSWRRQALCGTSHRLLQALVLLLFWWTAPGLFTGEALAQSALRWRKVSTFAPKRKPYIPGFAVGSWFYLFLEDSKDSYRATSQGGGLSSWSRLAGGAYKTKWGDPTAISNRYVYAVSWGRVRYTTVGAKGQLTPWKQAMPEAGILQATGKAWGTIWPATAVVETSNGQRFLYVMGGWEYGCNFKCGQVTSTVARSPIQPGGSLKNFTRARSLPEKNMNGTAVFAAGHLFLLGGSPSNDDEASTDKIQVAPLHANGSLGAWKTLSRRLPHRLSRSAALVGLDGYLYLVGGARRTKAYNNVYRANIQQGSLGAWQSLPALPEGIGYTPHGVLGKTFYILGRSSSGKVPLYATPFSGRVGNSLPGPLAPPTEGNLPDGGPDSSPPPKPGGPTSACDQRFSFTPPRFDLQEPVEVAFTDATAYTHIGLQVQGPQGPVTPAWIGVNSSSPYTWRYQLLFPAYGTYHLSFTANKGAQRLGRCTVLIQAPPPERPRPEPPPERPRPEPPPKPPQEQPRPEPPPPTEFPLTEPRPEPPPPEPSPAEHPLPEPLWPDSTSPDGNAPPDLAQPPADPQQPSTLRPRGGCFCAFSGPLPPLPLWCLAFLLFLFAPRRREGRLWWGGGFRSRSHRGGWHHGG